MINKLKQWLPRPHPFAEEEQLLAQMLTVILWTLFAVLFFALFVFIIFANQHVIWGLIVSLLSLGVAFWFLYKEHLPRASFFLVVTLQALILSLLYTGAGIHDEAIILYPLVILVASLVLSRRIYIVYMVLSSGLTMGVVYGEIAEWFTLRAPQTDARLLITVPLMLLITAVATRIIAETFHHSLHQIRYNEQALAVSNAALKIRTQALEAQESALRTYAQRTHALSEMAQLLAAATQDYNKVLDIVVQRIAESIGDSCELGIISNDGQWLELAAVYHPNPDIVNAMRQLSQAQPQRVYEGHAGQVIKTEKPVLITEAPSDNLRATFKPEYRSFLDQYPIYSRVLVPLHAQKQILGVISLTRFVSGHPYTTDDMAYLQDLADRAALAITNARLYDTVQKELAERKRIEAARETLIQELEAKNTELERFTYTVSHDLKSPLVTIQGFLGFLEKDALDGQVDRLQADITHIRSATNKMHHLLGDLLTLSRIGRLINPPQRILFSDLVQEAMHMVTGRLQEYHVQVVIQPEMPHVYGDRVRLVEALQNLLDNAIKFRESQVTPHIEIGMEMMDAEPVFYVRDNGRGIEPRYHEQVFGLFERLDVNVEGTGIGLALVKRIVEVHNGRIWVQSVGMGEGTTFYFTLPQPPSSSTEETSHAL